MEHVHVMGFLLVVLSVGFVFGMTVPLTHGQPSGGVVDNISNAINNGTDTPGDFVVLLTNFLPTRACVNIVTTVDSATGLCLLNDDTPGAKPGCICLITAVIDNTVSHGVNNFLGINTGCTSSYYPACGGSCPAFSFCAGDAKWKICYCDSFSAFSWENKFTWKREMDTVTPGGGSTTGKGDDLLGECGGVGDVC